MRVGFIAASVFRDEAVFFQLQDLGDFFWKDDADAYFVFHGVWLEIISENPPVSGLRGHAC